MIELTIENDALRVSGDLCKGQAALAQELLHSTLTAHESLHTLDLSGLAELDPVGLQLLVAVRRSMPKLRFAEPGQAALEVCQQFGALRLLFEEP